MRWFLICSYNTVHLYISRIISPELRWVHTHTHTSQWHSLVILKLWVPFFWYIFSCSFPAVFNSFDKCLQLKFNN